MTGAQDRTGAPPRDAPLAGRDLLAALAAAAEHLRAQASFIDAINVYPVPDGDTGSNMAATFREAVAQAGAVGPEPRVDAVLEGLARGALYGARGNSGVILSQALRGLAAAAAGHAALDGALLAAALERAAAGAYGAVARPVEGTMLTVLRAAAAGARAHAEHLPGGGAGHPCLPTLDAATRAAEAAEAATPTQLPALAEAGVTDSGGEGVCAILRGLVAALGGTALPPPPAVVTAPIATLAGHAEEAFGFCTEFILEPRADDLDVPAVRTLAEGGGNRSVVVVGDARALRIHVHTDDPEALLAAAGRLGALSRTKVEDMASQHGRFRASGSGAVEGVALLALSPGEGFDRLFASLGAAPARLPDILKPSAGEIVEAANGLGAADVLLLPNHHNVLLAARQAVALARCTLTVVPSTTLPQGLAAALAFDPAEPVAAVAEAMEAALATVVTVEVTIAAADRTAEGLAVRAGQAIALVDGRLVAARESMEAALLAGLECAGVPPGALITLYAGRETAGAELAALAAAVTAAHPDATVEALRGDQPRYPVIAAIER